MKTNHLLLLAIAILALSNCASTTFYGADGKPTARFQGDMTKVEYQRACDGSMRWSADTVNHSSATAAGGNAASKGILSTGTSIATSGIPAIVK
jgi:hypothetical protein